MNTEHESNSHDDYCLQHFWYVEQKDEAEDNVHCCYGQQA